ncbi:LysM peptidoglycan-binding domain-containing protein [Desmospora activa]|uniref:Spore germination protein n=1 Tax=Desmospora activa DSM 45169 TaxID=1121389 RepID=A0A2T4Z0E9_9BACL|nr:LysM peptidoglycan-binding domain-containing protein [Desmospora activa]PTM53217.1 spore germination protein [Desmospora activa DSM 45169]
MQIIVVNRGDSIWSIANRFSVSTTDIIQINQLTTPEKLVPGEALLVPVPAGVHIVQAGESLSSIANRYGISVEALRQANNIPTDGRINPGQRLTIPAAAKRTIEVNGFLEPANTEKDRRIIQEVAEYCTYISLFSYQVQADGNLRPLQDQTALQALANTRTVPMMVITNFAEGNFSPTIARRIFTDTTVRDRLIQNVLTTMRQKGYRALNIDFENLRTEDREQYNAFLRQITPRIKEAGFLVSTALAPKVGPEQTGAWYGAHDYPAHGEIVDFVILMTYEWGWSGGPPLPVAPIRQVRRVLDYAVSVIPRNKIMMGGALYGYDWTLPYVRGGPFAKTLSPQEAVDQARRVGAEILYDNRDEAPYYRYYDQARKEHIVWFEDARSMQAKFNLIKEYRLRGISYWVLGRTFPQNWALLADQFNIRKLR